MTTSIPNDTAEDAVLAASVLVLTQRHTPETEPTFAAIHRNFCDGDVRICADVAAATRLVERDRWYPDLVIVCQHWPGEFTSADSHHMLGLLPLARWICIRGSWCEADGRNGTPWPDAVSVRARAAAQRIGLERRVLDGLIAALPLTASRDEIFAFENQRTDETPASDESAVPHTVAVISADRELRCLLNDLLTADGFNVAASLPTKAPLAVIVWDVDPISPTRLADIQRLCETHSPAIIVAISNVAYPEDVEAFSARGVHSVVAKSNLSETLSMTIASALAERVPSL